MPPASHCRTHPARVAGPRDGSCRTTCWAAIAAGFVLLHAPLARAEPEWSIEARVGGAWNAPMPIVLRQQGQENLRIDPTWSSRSFEPPIYYGWRITRWGERSGWALDLAHHKLHLENPPPDVRHFAISHGYNLLTFGRARRWAGLVLWLNAGAVIAHPENTVRGAHLSESRGALGLGYYLAGATVGASVAKQFALGPRWLAALEAGLAGSTARVPVEGGHADVPNVALHLRAGLGRGRPRRPRRTSRAG